MIRQVFFETNIFEVDSAIRSLETLAELRHVKHVVHVCNVGGKLKLIGEIASLPDDLERATYLGASFPLILKRRVPFIGETRR